MAISGFEHHRLKGVIMNRICRSFVLLLLSAGIADAAPDNVTGVTGMERSANAVATDRQMFRFGGFGTLGASHSSQSLGDYVLDGTIPKGAGRSSNWAIGNDSRIGVQVAASFTPEASAVLQIISEYQSDNSYNPVVEWANIKYAFAPDAYIRAGRIALPTFLNSDSRKVGYSYPWIHPPMDLYRVMNITNSDGVDVMYRFEIVEAENSIRAIYGDNTNKRPTSISKSKDIWGIYDTLEYGSVTLRLGYQERVATSRSLLTGISGAPVRNSELSVGANYDQGGWFIMSEWIKRESTTKQCAMYLSGGYRIAEFTPYLTYSNNGKGSFLPGYPAPTAAAIQSARKAQSTTSIGVRWDFMKNTDFKLQYDRVQLGGDSNGYLVNLPAGTILYGTTFHVISAAVDFLF